MANLAGVAEYSIAAVSKLTGISLHALRVWERRYEYPAPHRPPRGIAATPPSRSTNSSRSRGGTARARSSVT